MLKDLIVPLLIAILSTIFTNLLTEALSSYPPRVRWAISGVVGLVVLVVAAALVLRAKPKQARGGVRIGSGNVVGGNYLAEGLSVTGSGNNPTTIADENEVEGDFTLKDVDVRNTKAKDGKTHAKN
jgi:hypothetical protein